MALNRLPTDGEMQIMAVPVRAAMDLFEQEPKVGMLAVFTLGLDLGRKDPAIASRMSEIGQAILTGGDALDEGLLDNTIALVNLLFIVEDAKQALPNDGPVN